jgi:hypothetical protein
VGVTLEKIRLECAMKGIITEIMPMRPHQQGKVEAINATEDRCRQQGGIRTAALTLAELETIMWNVILGHNDAPVPLELIPPETLRLPMSKRKE